MQCVCYMVYRVTSVHPYLLRVKKYMQGCLVCVCMCGVCLYVCVQCVCVCVCVCVVNIATMHVYMVCLGTSLFPF